MTFFKQLKIKLAYSYIPRKEIIMNINRVLKSLAFISLAGIPLNKANAGCEVDAHLTEARIQVIEKNELYMKAKPQAQAKICDKVRDFFKAPRSADQRQNLAVGIDEAFDENRQYPPLKQFLDLAEGLLNASGGCVADEYLTAGKLKYLQSHTLYGLAKPEEQRQLCNEVRDHFKNIELKVSQKPLQEALIDAFNKPSSAERINAPDLAKYLEAIKD